MIRFIYGESGIGRTRAVADMIKKDLECGIHCYLLVPEQAAISTERMMLDTLEDTLQLRLEILNFSRLYNRVCREYGGLRYNYITKPAKKLIMWDLLRELENELTYYTGARASSELPELICSAIEEFKASGISPASLQEIADKEETPSDLRAKLEDLSLMYSAYDISVAENFCDASDDLWRLADILDKHAFFEGCNVYVDGFTSFTAAQHKILERIFSGAENSVVTIPLPSLGFRDIYTESISNSERTLVRAAKERGGLHVTKLDANDASQSELIGEIAERLWRMQDSSPLYSKNDGQTVFLESCANPYAEAEAAARWTHTLLRQGYRCRDIVIVARSVDNYRGIIEPALARENIPYFLSEKSDISSMSPIKFILSALKIKSTNWRTTDVISHVKTGIYDLTQTQIDMFESYVNTWGIRGSLFTDGEAWTMNPDGYGAGISSRGQKILEAANAVKNTLAGKLVGLFTRLNASDNAKQMCRELYAFLVDCGMEEKIAQTGKKYALCGSTKEAREYASLYRVILDCISLVARILPDRKMSTDELASALKIVFDMAEIGSIPTSVDEVVIGSASLLRAQSPKCVLVLGLCEGDFPKSVSESGAFTSFEREILCAQRLPLSQNSKTRSSDELMFVRNVFSLPQDKLILFTARASSDGAAKQPSMPYLRVRAMLGGGCEHSFDERDLSYLSTSAQNASRYVYSSANLSDASAIRRALAEQDSSFSHTPAQKPSLSDKEITLSPELSATLFPAKMTLSNSRLEKYVKCPFDFYCENVLALRAEEEASFDAVSIGNFVHFLMENLLRRSLDENGNILPLDDAQIEKASRAVAEEYLSGVLTQRDLTSARMRHLCERIEKLALLVAKNIFEEFSSSRFTPALFEQRIGYGEGDIPPLEITLADSTKLAIRGIVDRVDVYRADGRVYVRVVDYKTGKKTFSLDDLSLGLNTQMLFYLFALCSPTAKDTLFGGDTPCPAGIMYLSSDVAVQNLEQYTDSATVLANAEDALKRNGLLLNDEEVLRAMNESLCAKFLAGIKMKKNGELSGKALTTLDEFEDIKRQITEVVSGVAERMKSGVADIAPISYGKSPCEYCSMKPVCRRIERKTDTESAENSEHEEE